MILDASSPSTKDKTWNKTHPIPLTPRLLPRGTPIVQRLPLVAGIGIAMSMAVGGIVSDRCGTWTAMALGLRSLVGGGCSGSGTRSSTSSSGIVTAAQRDRRLADVSQVTDLSLNLLHDGGRADEWAIGCEVLGPDDLDMIWHHRISPGRVRVSGKPLGRELTTHVTPGHGYVRIRERQSARCSLRRPCHRWAGGRPKIGLADGFWGRKEGESASVWLLCSAVRRIVP